MMKLPPLPLFGEWCSRSRYVSNNLVSIITTFAKWGTIVYLVVRRRGRRRRRRRCCTVKCSWYALWVNLNTASLLITTLLEMVLIVRLYRDLRRHCRRCGGVPYARVHDVLLALEFCPPSFIRLGDGKLQVVRRANGLAFFHR